MLETLKKYWWAIALGVFVYFFAFNKKGKNVRRRTRRRMTRMKSRYMNYRSNRRKGMRRTSWLKRR